MIIWGTRGLTSTVSSSQFHCPRCDVVRACNLRQVRNFFTLYFIPVIPLDVAGRYVECTSCGGTFAEEALSYNPEKERAETETQMLRIMVMSAIADGRVDEHERAAIHQQYQELTGLPLPGAKLDNEISMAMASGADLNAFVRPLVPKLSTRGKALAVKLAFHTMSASGDLQPGHQQQLAQLSSTLGISQDQYIELIRQLGEQSI